jgi:hypothetical protein
VNLDKFWKKPDFICFQKVTLAVSKVRHYSVNTKSVCPITNERYGILCPINWEYIFFFYLSYLVIKVEIIKHFQLYEKRDPNRNPWLAGKGGESRQILKKTRFYLLSKGYTCRFKSEAFASFALRPWPFIGNMIDNKSNRIELKLYIFNKL